jgi:hypothetical protein
MTDEREPTSVVVLRRFRARKAAVGGDVRAPKFSYDALALRLADLHAEYLRRVCGYALTGFTGANGKKTTFVKAVAGALEDYHRAAPIETFSASHADRHSTELADLRGAGLATANETDEGRRWAESGINMLTDGEPVRARFMFMRHDLFEFTPQLKLVISGNHKPSLRSVGDDGRHSVGLHDDAPTFETHRHAEAVAISSIFKEGRHAPAV